MENTTSIRLLKTRDLTETINDSIAFIKQNYKPLGRVVLTAVLPLLIVAGFFMSKYFSLIGSMAALQSGGGASAIASMAGTVGSVMIGYIGYIVAYIFLQLSVAQAFILYEQSGSEAVTSSAIFAGIRKDFWRYIGFNMALFFFVFLGMVVFVLAIVATIAMKIWLLTFIAVVALFCGMFYLMLSLAFSTYIFLRERLGIFASISRSMKLIKGYWWKTFGVFFVALMIIYFGSIVFTIPFYAMFFVKMMHSVKGNPMGMFEFSPLQTASFVFMLTGTAILYSCLNVTTILQYYNLVETKEGAGLLEEINKIAPTENI
jgi:hypothetical protein